MNAGLYVPMIWGGEELGLLCVEDTDEGAEFSEKDLAALMVVGQLLSLAVRHHLAAEGRRRLTAGRGWRWCWRQG